MAVFTPLPAGLPTQQDSAAQKVLVAWKWPGCHEKLEVEVHPPSQNCSLRGVGVFVEVSINDKGI